MCTYNLSSLHDPAKSFGDIKRSHLIKKISRGLPNVICGTLNGIHYQSFNLAKHEELLLCAFKNNYY